METSKKLYTGIDILKLICAFLILFMHTYSYDGGTVGSVFQKVCNIGVPFFFIASGFFFGNGLMRAKQSGDGERHYFKLYFLRIFRMYCIWTVLTVPVNVYNLLTIKPGLGISMLILYIVRAFFLSGSMGVYWYLLSILCVAVILYYVFRHPKAEIPLYVIAVVLFVIGLLYNGGVITDTWIGTIIHVVFGSERNFLTVGLFYMCIGYIASKKSTTSPSMPILLVSFVLCLILLVINILCWSVEVVIPFTAVLLFAIGLKWNPPVKKETSAHLRNLSTGLYLLHFPFIIAFDLYLKNGTLVNFGVTLTFSLGIFALSRLLPKKVRTMLFG